MKKFLTLLALVIGSLIASASAQTVQCQASNGAWGPCPLVSPVQEAQAVNSKISAGAATTLTQAFGASTTAGNSILCLAFEGPAAIPVITDAQGNTYVVPVVNGSSLSSATAPGFTVALATNIVGGTTDLITETLTSGSSAFSCHELKGTVTVGAAWDYGTFLQATSATLAFAQQQASVPNEMVFVGVGMGAGTINATPSLANNPSALTTVDQANTAPSGTAALAVYYSAHANVSSIPPPFTQTLSLSASETYSAVIVSVRPASLSEWVPSGNPCNNPGVGSALTTVQGATSGTAAVQILALSGQQKIYVCQLYIVSVSGTAPTFSLVYGTGANCATGQTVIFPAIATATTAGTIYPFPGQPFIVIPAGQALCYLDAGTTPVQNYILTYVQR